MNCWLETIYIQERRADIQREVEQYRQISQAQLGQSWFEQRMLSLGIWLVSVGERLCQRYKTAETPTTFISILQG